jgi:hypothetical protein
MGNAWIPSFQWHAVRTAIRVTAERSSESNTGRATRSAKKSGSLVGYLDWIDPEENSPRIGLKLIRHSFQG